MKAARRLSVFVFCGMMLFLTACGSNNPKAEINAVTMSASGFLNIEYTANSKVSKDDCKIKISVSQDKGDLTGTVYYFANLIEEDLVKGRRYIGLFNMKEGREWSIDGSLSFNGAIVTDRFVTPDILSVFGEGADVTVSFLINDKVVSDRALE